MSLKDKFDTLTKTQKIVASFILLVLFALVLSQCTAPAKAQFVGNKAMDGRGPEQVNLFSVDFQTTDGKRVGRGGQMSSLPPIGYVYIAATARRERGVSGYVGPRYRVVGGEFTDVSCSSTRCVSQATVFVAKE